jgi:hypothetical protein
MKEDSLSRCPIQMLSNGLPEQFTLCLFSGTRILASKPICPIKERMFSPFTTQDIRWLKKCIVNHQLFDA